MMPVDEELIPALNEQDMEWIRERDGRVRPPVGGVNLGEVTPFVSGETAPEALLRGGGGHFNLPVGVAAGPMDVPFEGGDLEGVNV